MNSLHFGPAVMGAAAMLCLAGVLLWAWPPTHALGWVLVGLGAALAGLFFVVLMVEYGLDRGLYRRYRRELHRRVPLPGGGFECPACGCRQVRAFDSQCPVCANPFEPDNS